MSPPTDEHRFQLRLPRSLYERLVQLAERQNRTVNGQLLTILESALGPVTTSVSSGGPTFLKDLLLSEDPIALRGYARNVQSEAIAALTLTLERMSVSEDGRITEADIYPHAVEFLHQGLPATMNLELFGLASAEYRTLAGIESVIRICAELMNLSATMRGGLRFAQGLPEFLALRTLLLVGAKAYAERFGPALAALISEPIETREGSRTTVTSLSDRRDLFFPEAFLGYADLPMRHFNQAWEERAHLGSFFESETSYRDSLVGFMLLLTLKAALGSQGGLYPGYRLIEGSSDAVAAFVARLSRDARFRATIAEALGESLELFQERWPERAAAVNGLGLGRHYVGSTERLPANVEFA